MDRHYRYYAAFFAGWLAALPAAAATLGPDEAVQYALTHNPEIVAVQADVQAAQSRAQASRGALVPEVVARYSVRASDNPLDAFADKLNTRTVTAADLDTARLNNPDASTLHMAQIAAQLPLYTGGRIDATIRAADERRAAAAAQGERARQLVAARALQAYFAAQAAREGVDIADAAMEAAQAHARTTASLVRQGRTVSSDRLTAEVNLAAYQSQREQANTRYRLALNQLKLAMGMPLDEEIALAPRTAPTPPKLTEPVGALAEQAVQKRADLAAARRQVQAGQAQVDAARAALRPQVDLVASTNWYDEQLAVDSNSWSVMGVVSQSLYSGGRRRNETAAARYAAAAARARLEGQEQAVRNDVRTAYANLVEAESRLTIARDNVDKARRSVALVRQRYGQGRTILIDLLQAERALVEARNEELSAGLALQSSRVALDLATGTL